MANLTPHLIEPILKADGHGFNPKSAGKALSSALSFLKKEWDWSGSKIADTLHLNSRTLNLWLKSGVVPIADQKLSPEIQGIVHLIAIHRSLSSMFEDPFLQKEWLNTVHPDFKVTPVDRISESMEGLIFVRQYLDYMRGRGA